MESLSARTGFRKFLVPKFILPAVIAAVAVAAFVLYWFEPQALFINRRVDEAAPGAETEAAKEDGSIMMEPGAIASGAFRSFAHETTGTATLEKAADGHHYVRLENFTTENGPDLFVYLSTAPATGEDDEAFAKDFVNLGDLKGNIGNQNYLVPDGTDLPRYRSVVIWCKRFAVGFGVAPLEPKV